MEDGGFLKTSCGSPNYAAPELLSAEIYAGPEVDIWSSGVILYTMLCAKLPFDDAYDNMRNLFRLIRSGTYTIPSYVSPMATDLIKRILVVDPLKRLSIKDIKNHPWFSVRVPLYINVPFERSAFRKGTIDQLALDQVCQDYAVADRQGLLEWVQMGAPVITDQRLSRHVRERRLVVCYRIFQTLNLTNLHKADASLRTAEDGKQPKTDNDTTEGGGKQVLLNSLLSEDNIGPARAFEMLSISDLSKAVVSTDRPVQKTLPQPFVSSTPGPTLVPGRKFGDDGHWRVGLWTTSDPRIVMHHIYAALKALSYEWKIVSSYDFKVRAIMNGNNVMFVAARYRLYRSHRKRDLPKHSVGHLPMHYVLDISLRAGTAMAFLIHVNRVQQALERHVDLSIAKPPPALKIMG
jgi:hypothetical protein